MFEQDSSPLNLKKHIIIGVSAIIIYFIMGFLALSYVGNIRKIFIITVVKLFTYLLATVEVNIIFVRFYNMKMKDSAVMQKLVVTRISIIVLTVLFLNSAFIFWYSSNLCVRKYSSNYLTSFGIFYDSAEVIKIASADLNSPQEYVGKLSVNTEQNSFSDIMGGEVKSQSLYYLITEDGTYIGVVGRSDLSNIKPDITYCVKYYNELKLIHSIIEEN